MNKKMLQKLGLCIEIVMTMIATMCLIVGVCIGKLNEIDTFICYFLIGCGLLGVFYKFKKYKLIKV